MTKVWSREESRERFPLPVTMMGWSLLRAPLESTLQQMAKEFALRAYAPEEISARIGCYVYARKGFFGSLRNWRVRPLGMGLLVGRVFYHALRAGARAALKPGRAKEELVLSMAFGLLASRWRSVLAAWESGRPELEARMRTKYMAGAPAVCDSFALEKMVARMDRDSRDFFEHDFTVHFMKNAVKAVLLKWLHLRGREAAVDLAVLAQGLDENFSVRMALDARWFAENREEFFARYGHLTDNWDIAAPLLCENPAAFEKLGATGDQLLAKFREMKIRRENLEDELRAMGGARIAELIDVFQRLVLMDEDMRAMSSLQYPEIKRLLTWSLTHPVLSAKGWTLDRLYVLTIGELRDFIRLGRCPVQDGELRKRAEEFFAALQTEAPYEAIEDAHGAIVPALAAREPAVSPRELKGQPVSGGKARGPVLVVSGFDDLRRLSPRHVLFVSNPTPVYAPFYSACAGIISETGGQLSHGAIVAREFGIPMVTGIQGLFSSSNDSGGELWAEIDGETGNVEFWREGTEPHLSP